MSPEVENPAEIPAQTPKSANGGILAPQPQRGVVQTAPTRAARPPKRWPRWALLLLLAAAIGGGGYYAWRQSQPTLPPGIASGNGRIEADEIDIDAKFAGRIAEMLADEGDIVKAGQPLARLDTRDLEASLHKAESLVEEATQALAAARASVEQLATQQTLAQQEFDRAAALVAQGYATQELLDQRRQGLNGANAALAGARNHVGEAERAQEAATHDVELYKVNIADDTLAAPRDGRIQYRIANIGEVVPAGGRVFTMFDVAYVYMDIYLPTGQAGQIKLGSEARIVLDALPRLAIPAKVAFVATEAQFTPKTVETKDERDKLMFRVRVRVDPERLRAHADAVRSGLPGLAFVKYDANAAWPEALSGNAAP